MRNTRIFVICICIAVVAVSIIYRLYQLQINDNISFQILANSEQKYSTSISTSRGIIKSSDGIELAINIPQYDAYVYIPNITNLQSFEQNVLPLFSFDKALFEKQKNQGLQYFQIGTGISPNQKSAIEAKLTNTNTNSVQFILTQKRSYPNNTLLSQVLGFVYPSSGEGQYGIEQYFDGDLKGVDGNLFGNKDQFGNPIVNSNFNFIPPSIGEDITLTVDAHLQKIIETKLAYWVDNQEADSGSVIVMDPKSGAIIAMANYPTFDPNTYYNGYILDCNNYVFAKQDACKDPTKKLDPSLLQSSFENQAISNVYEPGSVMKAITAAAALEEKKITPDTIFNDSSGYYEANTKYVYNFNKQPDGKMNMAEILKKSSNVGASMVAQLVGKDLLVKYTKAFGIGTLTGITLQGEQTGLVPDPGTWADIDLATASFGQFYGATSLQVIGIYQTIANKGIRMQPYIVKSVVKDSQEQDTKPVAIGRVISTDTASKLTDMLTYATTGEPAYGLRFLKQYMPEIASKTGSAQVPLSNKAGYADGIINATYVGYAPAKDPKFVMLVMLKYPRAGLYAATTAVPLWADIAKELFLYYKIPPQ